MHWVLDKVVDQSDCGASLGNTKITDLVFAVDAIIFAESLEVLVMALEAMHAEAKPLRFEVSWLKTKGVAPRRAVLDTSECSSQDEDEEVNFYKALMSPGLTPIEGTNSTRLSNKMGKELERWSSEKQWNKLLEQATFPALSHAAWVDVFLKYNTAIYSSAPVERLSCQGADIMKAKRASLTSDNFDRLVFMKGNLIKMELSPEDSE
ncbi:hypothetical protein GWK47_032094 [Chionoecetes opilio]|uniref:HAT C-terminal dimerisation domain-containing protein n=1 Tax=Chionoecetes opilio TaxID=41210 RepID=A0A8J5D0W8_CHIOP|nr:hypothetical protein GWK47_032094 [Chionoecetes opilio]